MERRTLDDLESACLLLLGCIAGGVQNGAFDKTPGYKKQLIERSDLVARRIGFKDLDELTQAVAASVRHAMVQ